MAVVAVEHLAKTYPGQEPSLRGTKLEWRGPALWLRNLTRAVRLTATAAPAVAALREVSLTIAPGEIFGLIGRNGSGKTTLIKILAGLIRPSAGSGTVAGISLDHPQAIRAGVSYVSTSGWMGLEWPLTAEENIRLFAALCGLPERLARARTAEALHDVDLWAERGKYPAQLSNGMRQRVILARALLLQTPLLLLDEPTVGLDPLTTETILTLIRGKLRERGQAILITDHQAAEVEAVADRIGILEEGVLTRVGTPVALLAPLAAVTVIEIQTEEMDRPPGPPPPGVLAADAVDRPGALGVRAWRVYARRRPEALQTVLDWIEQPAGRIVLLAEHAPALPDLLRLPDPDAATPGGGSA
jgi:ABC-type multidrug transport system ATPase subunit